MTIPLGIRVLEDNKLNTEAQHIASVIRSARSEAIFHGKPVRISFYVYDNSYKLYYTHIPDKQDIRYRLPSGIEYVGATTFPKGTDRNPYCGFTSTGTPSSGGTITLTNNQGTKRYIIINPVAGRIRVANEPPANWE